MPIVERYAPHRDGLTALVRAFGWTFARPAPTSRRSRALLALYRQIAETG